MVELIGDVCAPSDLNLPTHTTTELDFISGLAVTSGMPIITGLLVYNSTLGKAEVWTGVEWETITSVAR